MEHLSVEGRAIYDTITTAATAQHAQHKEEISSLIDKSVNEAVDAAMVRSVNKEVRTCISKATADMQMYSDGVETALNRNLEALRSQLGLAAYSDEPDPSRIAAGDAETGQLGHRVESTTRGPGVRASGPYIPPPARGMRRNQSTIHVPRSFDVGDDTADFPSRHRMPKMDVPKFDGDQPKLWQIQCEDYFDMYETSPTLWVRLASLQFTGPAARWLSSIKSSIRKYTWPEFCQEVVSRFGRNQHQSLIRRLYKLTQTGSVEEYVTQFSELIDQLAGYEDALDSLHYVTRFIDGLKPSVKVFVACQLPQDLETAYNIALVQEEVGDGLIVQHSSSVIPRRARALPQLPIRPNDSVKPHEAVRSSDDKLAALKNYRRAKGLCFTCGERWAKEHKCQPTVQLHVVQEMVEFL